MKKQMFKNNPFSKTKTKTIIYWFIIAVPILILCFIVFGIFLNLPELTKNSQVDFEDPLFTNISINILFYFLIVLWLIYYQARSKFRFKYLIGKMSNFKKHVRLLLLVIPMLVFSVGTAEIIFYLLFFVSPETASEFANQDLLLTAEKTNYPLLYNAIEIISIIIIAPITEEVLFRGIFLHRWSTKWSIATATIISSIVFGCLHFNFIGISMLGFVLALTYLRTKSLIIPIAIHFLNNLIAVLLSLVNFLDPSQETSTFAEVQSYWWQGAIAIVISLPWLIIFSRNNWKFTQEPLPYFANRGN